MTIFNYTVNYFDVIIAAIIIVMAIAGWRKGLAISVANFIRYSFGMFLCFYTSSNCSQLVYDNYVKQKCIESINQNIAVSNNLDETINNLNEYVKTLPPFISQFIDTKSIDISSTDIAESILTNVFEPIVMVIIKVVLFIAVFVIFFGLTGIIMAIVKHRMKKQDGKKGEKSKLRTADKLCGLAFGVIKSFVVILAISSILMYFIDLDEAIINDTGFFREAAESRLLMFISDINPFNAITEGLL